MLTYSRNQLLQRRLLHEFLHPLVVQPHINPLHTCHPKWNGVALITAYQHRKHPPFMDTRVIQFLTHPLGVFCIWRKNCHYTSRAFNRMLDIAFPRRTVRSKFSSLHTVKPASNNASRTILHHNPVTAAVTHKYILPQLSSWPSNRLPKRIFRLNQRLNTQAVCRSVICGTKRKIAPS